MKLVYGEAVTDGWIVEQVRDEGNEWRRSINFHKHRSGSESRRKRGLPRPENGGDVACFVLEGLWKNWWPIAQCEAIRYLCPSLHPRRDVFYVDSQLTYMHKIGDSCV